MTVRTRHLLWKLFWYNVQGNKTALLEAPHKQTGNTELLHLMPGQPLRLQRALVASLSVFDLYVCLLVFSYLFNHNDLSDHNGWTALHHAAMGGYTQTMKVILDTNLKCTDRLDEEGVGTRSLWPNKSWHETKFPSLLESVLHDPLSIPPSALSLLLDF